MVFLKLLNLHIHVAYMDVICCCYVVWHQDRSIEPENLSSESMVVADKSARPPYSLRVSWERTIYSNRYPKAGQERRPFSEKILRTTDHGNFLFAARSQDHKKEVFRLTTTNYHLSLNESKEAQLPLQRTFLYEADVLAWNFMLFMKVWMWLPNTLYQRYYYHISEKL